MKYVFHIIFLFVFSVIQPTWIEYISFFGVKPNLFLIYVTIASCYSSKKEGAILGFISGLILDLFIGRIIGLSAVLMMVLGFLVSNFFDAVLRKNNVLVTMLIVSVSAFLYELLYYIIAFMGDLDFSVVFIKTLLPECVCSAVIAVLIYFLVKKFSKNFWTDKGEEVG